MDPWRALGLIVLFCVCFGYVVAIPVAMAL